MTRYLTIAEYLWLAEQVTGIEAMTLARASRTALADSGHVPYVGVNSGTRLEFKVATFRTHPVRL